MQSETKQCQNCKCDFTIEPEDFAFYEKIKVPPPTFCPECRLIRRLAYRENRSLYKAKCKNCNKDIITIYNKTNDFPIFCSSCWWSDSWEATNYGREYDFSRSFFLQFQDLLALVPNQAIFQKKSVNCNYSNGNVRCKNCVLTFDGFESIDCYNCQAPILTRNSVDSDIIWNADHAYENLDSEGVYNTKFVYYSKECLDSAFLFNCIGCSDCFGCINLRNKKYCILNKQYTRDEYKEEIKKWDLGSYSILEKAKRTFEELYYQTPRRFASILNSQNVTGDNIRNVKNCQTCFSVMNGVENCRYVFLGGMLLKDSLDITFGGDTSNLLYEVNGVEHSERSFFCRGSNDSRDVQYCDRIYDSSNCFGCTKLRKKKYCILNKQYSKEQYEELVPKIIKHMNEMPYVNNKGIIYKYGEFFPPELSSWAYNETQAQNYFPLTKEEAITKGFRWYDDEEKKYQITLLSKDLSDHIDDVSDSILNEIIECKNRGEFNSQCTTAFRILPEELSFYRSMRLSLPRLCPVCRFEARIKKKNPLRLWHRKCMCNGIKSEGDVYQNTSKHSHGDSPCQNEFETAISPERKEIVYCEKCYQEEFI